MKKIVMILILLNAFICASQDGFYLKDYNWKSKPDVINLSQEELLKDQIGVFEKKCIHFYQKDGAFVKGVLEHKMIRLNNDKAIENNNKYYVSNAGATEVIIQKARVIKPNGETVELSSKDIQTSKDKDGNSEYQYFAFEGIEVGSTIEYLHIMNFPVKYSGEEVRVQSYYQKKNLNYELVCPSHLEFKLKSINGLPEFFKDTTEQGYNRYSINCSLIDGIEEESESSYASEIQKFYYMLFRNLYTGKSNFYNYQDVTKNLYSEMYIPLTSKEIKAVNKFISESGALKASTTLEKVCALERYLKKTIVIQEDNFEQSLDILKILQGKLASEDGATKLMMNCLRTLNVNFELVVTCDRFDNKFLSDFQGYNFLKVYMLYINELDGYYISQLFYRFGFPPPEYLYSNGLFIKEINLNGLISSIGAVRKIKGKSKDDSVDEILADVTILDDNSNVEIAVKRTTTGYKSMYYQSYIDFVSPEDVLEIKNDYLSYIDSDVKPENMIFENDSSSLFGFKPFIGKGVLKSQNFIEHAGNKLLLKVGMLIGPQANLYNSKERKLPVELEFLRSYSRIISLKIPDGYKVKNLDNLATNVTPNFEDNSMGFTSTYELKGNELTIQIKEWYGCVSVPVKEYKSYFDVVNAAADFNKLILVLEKI